MARETTIRLLRTIDAGAVVKIDHGRCGRCRTGAPRSGRPSEGYPVRGRTGLGHALWLAFDEAVVA